MNSQEIRNLIIDIIKKDGNKKIPPGIIIRKILDTKPYVSKHSIFKTIDEMISDGELKQLSDNKVVLGYINAEIDKSEYFIGTISLNSVLDGFVSLYDDNNELIEEFYINKINTNGALKDDIVKFALLKKEIIPPNRREAAVVEIIKRNRQTIVGTVSVDENSYLVTPDDNKVYLDIIIKNIDIVKDNDKVLLEILRYTKTSIITKIIKVIGNKNDIGVDIESIVYENKVPLRFNENAITESKKLNFQITEKDLSLRKDIRNRKIITIDPETSKDLDDAIYVEQKENGNFFLSVSIADVSSYVKLDSELDKEAFIRSTSVYLLDRVIPMLPNNISDNLCSLNENEDKMTLTCDMEIDSNGNLVNYDVYPSIMRNHRRFSYDEVNKIFEKNIKESNYIDQDILNQLWVGKKLHHILRQKKQEIGYIEFILKEPLILLDDKGIPTKITFKKSGTAQKMIEDFMVSCNETVTLFAKKNEIPFIYRVHEKPELKKINSLNVECSKLGLYSNVDYLEMKSLDLAKLMIINKDNVNFKLFNKLLLKTMQKAMYKIENIGHFGLALNNYTHFTSPIRRYADLIVHRLFWMYLFDKQSYSDSQRIELNSQLEDICNECNFCEIRQIDTERKVNAMKIAEYMSYRIGKQYDGYISNVVSFGLFVEIEDSIEGLVPIKSLADDFYVFNNENFTLVGRKNNKVYSTGQKVKIEVVYANKNERKIDFKIIY